ncbi:MAG TPA: HPr family phosphocarrier protein, partial [Cyanobacteria bacterium UBA11049]|nr:HPr family phosphocarrier protein [Cyanobacteria bacterium UBA11049]
MVGIVIVSHSKQLAEGVRELAQQMVQGKVPLAVAAGIDDRAHPLGTDATSVHQAIESIYSDDGVVVLMDLGSALMSAEMALEFLCEEQRENVRLCEAPLVEGAIAAAVAAASGSNIKQVLTEARAALAAKTAQLGLGEQNTSGGFEKQDSKTKDSPSEPTPIGNEQYTEAIRLTIQNQLGLHARPAAKLVTTASQFQSQIQVRNITRNTEYVRADSINRVATLGVRQGHEIAIAASGDDADVALAALQALVETNFGEDNIPLESLPITPSPSHPITPSLTHFIQGIPASFGVAIAPVFQYRPRQIKVEELCVGDVNAQWQRLQAAIDRTRQDIQTLHQSSSNATAIFDAHLLFLTDPALLEPVRQRILEQHQNAEFAWQTVVNEIVAAYRQLEDAYIQERANDVVDVGQRVLLHLAGTIPNTIKLTQPCILVATDLSPSDTAQLEPTMVLGICTTLGSATSHTVILARTLGIPVIVGVSAEILNLSDGTLLALDGESGKVWINPESDTLAALLAKRDAIISVQEQAQATAKAPAITRDGRRVTVLANISGIADAQIALERGAEGVGLLRTEFLYLGRNSAPSEDEQLEIYRAIAQILDRRPFIIRTLDIGGDKPIPYL